MYEQGISLSGTTSSTHYDNNWKAIFGIYADGKCFHAGNTDRTNPWW